MIINTVLSVNEIVLVVDVKLVKPNVMQNLVRINIIIQVLQVKVRNYRNTIKTICAIVLHKLSNAPNNAKNRKDLKESVFYYC